MDISFRTLNSHDVDSIADALGNLYEDVYREAPYCEGPEQFSRFRSSLGEDADRPGFTLVVATQGDWLFGAAYGWTMPAGRWWSRSDIEPERWIIEVDKFAVMEWIVHPDKRGQGAGNQLIRTLLEVRAEPVATLASDPRSEARAIYERAGWFQVAGTSLTWGPAMDLLILDRRTSGNAR